MKKWEKWYWGISSGLIILLMGLMCTEDGIPEDIGDWIFFFLLLLFLFFLALILWGIIKLIIWIISKISGSDKENNQTIHRSPIITRH